MRPMSRRGDRVLPPGRQGASGRIVATPSKLLLKYVVHHSCWLSWRRAGGGAVGALTARRLAYNRNSTAFAAPDNTQEHDPHLTVNASEKAVYTETMTATWALWLAVGLLVIALVLGFVVNWIIATVVALSTLPVLLLVPSVCKSTNTA